MTITSTEQNIVDQQEQLQAHRTTLAFYLQQLAHSGEAHISPSVFHGINTARSEIRRIKTVLRESGQIVDDDPNDEGPPVFAPSAAISTLNNGVAWNGVISQRNIQCAIKVSIPLTFSLFGAVGWIIGGTTGLIIALFLCVFYL